ncbi:MAG: hypothetical protein EAZ37_01115 [Burkholderiales bacterium]|nr:MAG: hypothetical protein EAZ43_08715 [Betaproteobacteria bacterium]TAG28619.1 MAG: hypothetical protein EAZ37_01115 [Burkholderiales bacterium]
MTIPLTTLQATLSALAGGSLVLSPSDRARRSFQRLWRRVASSQSGSVVSPEFMTTDAWFRKLWSDAQCYGLIADERSIASPTVESALWREAVAATAPRDSQSGAVATAALATLMQEAFALEHRYASANSAAGATHATDGSINGKLYDDAKRFFVSRLSRGNAISSLMLPALIARYSAKLHSLLPTSPGRILLTPSFAPIASELGAFAALSAAAERAAGPRFAPFHRIDLPESNALPHPRRAEYVNEREEREAVIAAASRYVESDNARSATIVVPSLSSQRELWRRALSESGVAFNLSLGRTLGSFSDTAVMLNVVAASSGEPLDIELTAQSLRHPRWALSDAQRRAVAIGEVELLSRGKKFATVDDFSQFIGVPNAPRQDPNERLTRREWLANWALSIKRLTAAHQPVDSATFQLRAAISELGTLWCELDDWMPALTATDANAEWRDQLNRTTFQPEDPGASIEVVGLLESAGTINDALWITGLTDAALPERSRLNPFLSAAWQRRENIGLASIAECGARAERLWRGWCAHSQTLTVSAAASKDGQTLLASPLISALPAEAISASLFTPTPMIPIVDELDPSPLSARSKLNASGLEAQAKCPRRGWALGRLRANLWPERYDGLSPLIKGNLLHNVAELLGRDRMAAQDEGATLDPAQQLQRLPEHIDTAISHWRNETLDVPRDVWLVERERLLVLFEKFIELEASREPFFLEAVEHKAEHDILGHTLQLRVDRVERLSDDSLAIIDFKSGVSKRPGLSDERLSSPQLPLYALAMQVERSEGAVSCVSYAQINEEGVQYIGIADDGKPQAAFRSSRQSIVFDELKQRWPHQLAALVEEFRSGAAPVAPMSGDQTCQRCGFERLCRVQLRALEDADT